MRDADGVDGDARHDGKNGDGHGHSGRRYPRLTEAGKKKHLDELAYMMAFGPPRIHPSDPVTGNPDPDEPEGPTGPYLR